jgi:hypothetical protein
MWRNYLQKLSTDCRFNSGADAGVITTAERDLQIQLPSELTEVLSESDGVMGQYGLGLVWPIDRICSENMAFRSNEQFRELYMPFDNLLFFADAGNGDQFAFAVCSGAVRRPDIFAWNHENDSRCWVAPSLRVYLEWWLTGRIKL